MQWGRLLFDPDTADNTFAVAYTKKLGLRSLEEGLIMLSAIHAVGIMPLRLASFVYNTFDFSLYSEGFTQAKTNKDKAEDNPKGFISIETLILTKTLDPTLQSVADFVRYLLLRLTIRLILFREHWMKSFQLLR